MFYFFILATQLTAGKNIEDKRKRIEDREKRIKEKGQRKEDREQEVRG